MKKIEDLKALLIFFKQQKDVLYKIFSGNTESSEYQKGLVDGLQISINTLESVCLLWEQQTLSKAEIIED